MKEILLKAEIHSQTLTLKTVSDIAEKSQNYLQMEVIFDDVWKSDDITSKVCVFSKNGKKYEVAIEDNVCLVPWEVLREKGYVKVACYALADGNTVITTNTEKFYVANTATGELSETQEATPTIYTQMMTGISNLTARHESDVAELDESIESVKSDATELEGRVAVLETNTEGIRRGTYAETSVVSDNNNKDEILTLIEDDNIVFKKLKELRANPNNSTIKWVKVYTTWVLGKDGDIVSSTGKRMTDNNYTTEEKEKLASLENYDDTEIAADVEKLKTETAADVEKLKTETAADVEKLNSDVETLGSDIESLKTEVTENKNSCETDINDVKQKTQYILANGDAIQTDGLLSLIGKTQTMVGVTDDEDRTLYRNWENILSGIRFTSDGIEIKSGGGSITIDGDGVNITSGDVGISVGSDGTSFVGSTPYEGTTEMLGVTENEVISCDVSDIETTEED